MDNTGACRTGLTFWRLTLLRESFTTTIPGDGVKIACLDGGICPTHPDLADRLVDIIDDGAWQPKYKGKTYQQAINKNYTWKAFPGYHSIGIQRRAGGAYSVWQAETDHGTACAGILAANGSTYVSGVAPGAKLADFNHGPGSFGAAEALLDFGLSEIDIYSCSWGASGVSPDLCFDWCTQMELGGLAGRNGLGTIYCFAAGNAYLRGANANLEALHNAQEAIIVGARNIDSSVHTAYATPGSCILVAGIGANDASVGAWTFSQEKAVFQTWSEAVAQAKDYDEFKTSVAAMATGTPAKPPPAIGNTVPNRTHGSDSGGVVTCGPYPDQPVMLGMDGTSAATPMVAGVCALLISYRKDLSYRDVKMILAKTAQVSLTRGLRNSLGNVAIVPAEVTPTNLYGLLGFVTDLDSVSATRRVKQADGSGAGTGWKLSALQSTGGLRNRKRVRGTSNGVDLAANPRRTA